MHSKSDNIEIMINDEANEVIEELFDSLKNRCQNNLESMKGSEFVFNYVYLLYYKCHKINPNRGGSYIDSPDWIKNKKATINPTNKKDNKCFQYNVTVTLNHGKTGKNPERITKLKTFINKYKWEGINSPSEREDWKKFEKNNVKIAFNIKKRKIYPAYFSKNKSNREKQFILLMISMGKGGKASSKGREAKSKGQQSHYFAVKKLSALLRGITSKHYDNFYCLNCLYFFRKKNKLESHKKSM